MIILDTNVVSELLKESPDEAVVRWARPTSPSGFALTAITVMEVRHGVERMPTGRRRDRLDLLFARFRSRAVGEVLSFDVAAAEACATYLAERGRSGRPLADVRDAQIAGIVISVQQRDGRATLATRNTAHFVDLNNVVNPWTA